MKKHFRKLFITFFIAVCAVCFAVGFAACNKDNGNGNGGDKQPTPLATPVLRLSGNVLSWDEVPNAESYEVYEGNSKVVDTEETTYTINKATPCDVSYKIKAVTSNEKYTESGFSNEQRYHVTEQLATPEITLSGTVITWETVPHATGYWVYENGEVVQQSGEKSYTITKKAVADVYEYKVKAVSSGSLYTESNLSDAETFTVTALATPTISVDENAILRWTEVPNAEKYEIYADGYLIEETTDGTSYAISQNPGQIEYKVVAMTQSVYFADSEATKIYDAPLIAEITVNIPQGFNCENVKVVLSNETEHKEVEITDYTEPVRVVVEVGIYTVELTGLSASYVSTPATVSGEKRFGTISVIEVTGENSIDLGQTSVILEKNNFSGAAEAATVSATKEFIFKAGATDLGDGVHTITATDNDPTKKITITANNVKLVNSPISVGDSDSGEAADFKYNSGTFTLESGKSIIFTFLFEVDKTAFSEISEDTITFNIEIEDREVKKYLEILSDYYNNEPENGSEQDLEQKAKTNGIIDSSTRYIKTNETQYLTFVFSYSTIGQYTDVTIKINGKEYGLSFGVMLETAEPELFCAGCDENADEVFIYYCTRCGTSVDKDATVCPNPDCSGLKKGSKCGECGSYDKYKVCTTCGAHVNSGDTYCQSCEMPYNIAFIEFEAQQEVKVEIVFSGSGYGRHDVVSFWVCPKKAV